MPVAPYLLHLMRSFATSATNEAVERTIVVDTLAQVRVLCDTLSAHGQLYSVMHASVASKFQHHLPCTSAQSVFACVQAKKFESVGLSREQAEQLTQHLTEQIVLDRVRLIEKFTAKVELEKVLHLSIQGMALHNEL